MRVSRIMQPQRFDNADVPDSVELPVASLIQGELNCMSRDVQTQLRKKTYAFAQADAVLTDLGVRNTWRGPSNKKGNANIKGQKRQQGEAAAAATDVSQPSSKRARDNSEAMDASQAAAQAADVAADARAESILHVPETSAFPTGTANSSAQLDGHIPDKSASSAAPGQEPMPGSPPPAAQTSLAAAAAAALGAQPAPVTDGPSGLQVQGPNPDDAGPAGSASVMNGHASSSMQHGEGEPAKLYDVSR